jgi:hypothetical protein
VNAGQAFETPDERQKIKRRAKPLQQSFVSIVQTPRLTNQNLLEPSKPFLTCEERVLNPAQHERWLYLDDNLGGNLCSAMHLQEHHRYLLNGLVSRFMRGGFLEYFYNTPGSHFGATCRLLDEAGKHDAVRMLRTGKEIFFSTMAVPEDELIRNSLLSRNDLFERDLLSNLEFNFRGFIAHEFSEALAKPRADSCKASVTFQAASRCS